MRIAPDFWQSLVAARSTGEEWRVRTPFPELMPRLLGSVSVRGERRFLIALGENESAKDDTRSRGVSLRTLELTDGPGRSQRFLVVECLDTAGHELFDLIGAEIAQAMTVAPPAEAAVRVLAKWRRFWGQTPRSILSREEQIGLFAEIWFLKHWLLPTVGTQRATHGWRGPAGSRHDFEWPGLSIEVKGSTRVRQAVFTVHGLEQLEPPENGKLLFFAVRLREEGGAPHTLPSLIAEARNDLKADENALDHFDSALARMGYSPAHEPDYAQTRWRVVDARLYPVDDVFPRLGPHHFPNGLPPGVSEIQYAVDLEGFGDAAYKSPEEAAELLR
jgi:hypothetical protein